MDLKSGAKRIRSRRKFYQSKSEVAIIHAGGRRSEGSSPEGESNIRSLNRMSRIMNFMAYARSSTENFR